MKNFVIIRRFLLSFCPQAHTADILIRGIPAGGQPPLHHLMPLLSGKSDLRVILQLDGAGRASLLLVFPADGIHVVAGNGSDLL